MSYVLLLPILPFLCFSTSPISAYQRTGNVSGLCQSLFHRQKDDIGSYDLLCSQIKWITSGNGTICKATKPIALENKLNAYSKGGADRDDLTMTLQPYVWHRSEWIWSGLNLTFTTNRTSTEFVFCFLEHNDRTRLICRDVKIERLPNDSSQYTFFYDCVIATSHIDTGYYTLKYASKYGGKGKIEFKMPNPSNIDLQGAEPKNWEVFWYLHKNEANRDFVLDIYPFPKEEVKNYLVQLIDNSTGKVLNSQNLSLNEDSQLVNISRNEVRRYLRAIVPKPLTDGQYKLVVTPVSELCSSSCFSVSSEVQEFRPGFPYSIVVIAVIAFAMVISILLFVLLYAIPKWVKRLLEEDRKNMEMIRQAEVSTSVATLMAEDTINVNKILLLYENSNNDVCNLMKELGRILSTKYHFIVVIPDSSPIQNELSVWIRDEMESAAYIVFCGPKYKTKTTKRSLLTNTTEKVNNIYRTGCSFLACHDAEHIREKSIQVSFPFSSRKDRDYLMKNVVYLMSDFKKLVRILESSRHSRFGCYCLAYRNQLSKEERGNLERHLRSVGDSQPVWEEPQTRPLQDTHESGSESESSSSSSTPEPPTYSDTDEEDSYITPLKDLKLL